MKLSHSTVGTLKLPRGKAEAIVFDDDIGGFGLRIRAGGSRTWIFEYKLGAKGRRMTLGSLAAVTPAQARKTAGELHAMVRLGRDPAGEKSEGRARAAETMGAALQAYLPFKQTCLRPGSYAEVERHLVKHCRPLHGLHISKIDRRAVASLMAAVAAKSGAVGANRTRASIAALSWSEVGEGRIVLPPERTKNNREHVVPLSPEACAILERPRRGDFVFGRDIGRPFSGWSKSKERLDARITKTTGEGLAPWTVHDVRRSVATHMAELGIQPHVIEATLNHVSGHKAGVAGIYNRSSYEREVRAALALWSDHLLAAVEGRSAVVVPLTVRP